MNASSRRSRTFSRGIASNSRPICSCVKYRTSRPASSFTFGDIGPSISSSQLVAAACRLARFLYLFIIPYSSGCTPRPTVLGTRTTKPSVQSADQLGRFRMHRHHFDALLPEGSAQQSIVIGAHPESRLGIVGFIDGDRVTAAPFDCARLARA